MNHKPTKSKFRKRGWNRGKHLSIEHRKHLSEANLGKKMSKKARAKMSKAKIGTKLSLKTKNKMSQSAKKVNHFWVKRKKSEYTRKRMVRAQRKRFANYKRKKYKRYIHLTNTSKYKKWRMAVFLRDNFVCQFCFKRGYVEAHHIKSWAKYPKLRFDVNNGITLCKNCHILANKNNG